MKRFLILLLFLLISLSARAQIITSTVVVTNMPTNGYTFSVNGHLRTWTNNVTAANNQIPTYFLVGTNIQGCTNANEFATNLWISYIVYPEANLNVNFSSSNTLVFTSYPNDPLTIATNGEPINWATWTFFTNTITNEIVVRVPTNGIGIYERTNVGNGLIDWLNSPFDTNAVIATLPQWSNFVNATSLASLSNYVNIQGTNLTNLTYTFGTNSTNYGLLIGTNATNYVNYFSNIYWLALTWTTNTFGTLLNNVQYHDLAPLLGNTNSILMTNQPGLYRLYAQDNGGSQGGVYKLFDSQGRIWMEQDAFDDTSIQDYIGNLRIEIDYTGAGGPSGNNYFRTAANNNDMVMYGLSESVATYKPITFNTASTMPAVAIGTLTNFFDQEENSGTGATTVDSITIPANMLTNNGDALTREITVALPTTGASRRVEVSFAAAGDIVDTGSGGFTLAAGGAAKISLTITRSGDNAYNWSSSVIIQGPTSPVIQVSANSVSSFNSGSGWAASSVFPIVLTTASVGGLTGDLIIATDSVKFQPASQWAYLH